eukprot:g2654.t1
MVSTIDVILAVIFVALMLYAFLAISLVCDDYLVPALVRVCQRFSLPAEAAGASLLAFGSSAPEIVISAISVAGGAASVDLGLTSVLGSAIIAFALVPAAVVWASPERLLTLRSWPFARDLAFFLISLLMLLSFTFRGSGQITWPQSLALVCIYPAYLASIWLPLRCGGGPSSSGAAANLGLGEHEPRHGGINDAEASQGFLAEDERRAAAAGGGGDGTDGADSYALAGGGQDDGNASEEWPRPLRLAAKPIAFVLKYTCPPVAEDGRWEHFYGLTFLIAIAGISSRVGLPQFIEGSIMLALGAQIPDTLASCAMAKQGLGGGALSNAVGSQIVNVLLGFGLSAFLFSMSKAGAPLPVGHAQAAAALATTTTVSTAAGAAPVGATTTTTAAAASKALPAAPNGGGGAAGMGDKVVVGAVCAVVVLYGVLAAGSGLIKFRRDRQSSLGAADAVFEPRLGPQAATALFAAYVLCNVAFVVVAAVDAR